MSIAKVHFAARQHLVLRLAVLLKTEELEMAAGEPISTGVRATRSLRDRVGNFIRFEQEVR